MKTITQKIKELKAKRQRILIEMYASGIYSHDEVARQIGINYAAARSFFNLWKERYDFPAAQPGNVGVPKKEEGIQIKGQYRGGI